MVVTSQKYSRSTNAPSNTTISAHAQEQFNKHKALMVPRVISHSSNLRACCLEQESIQGPPPSSTFNYSERHASQAPHSLPTVNSISLSERARVLKFCFVIPSCAVRNSNAILHTKYWSCTENNEISKISEKLSQCKKIRFKYKPPFTANERGASFSLRGLGGGGIEIKYFNQGILLFKSSIYKQFQETHVTQK